MMRKDLLVTTKEKGNYALIYTDGYINDLGGEKIADACYELVDNNFHLICLNDKSNRNGFFHAIAMFKRI